MPYHEADPSDPNVLVGNTVDCTQDELMQMAASFAGELAQMGHGKERILRMFQRPRYAGPYLAWNTLGEQRVRKVIEEAVAFWSRCRFHDRDATGKGRARA